MIYTVTLNPSMDFFVDLEELVIGELNRMSNDYKVPGGKGINISRVLRQLGMPSVATGFIGGYTGQFIEDWLEREDIQRGFIHVDDDSRINVKLLKQEETVINAKGPNVSVMEYQEFLYYMSRVEEGDTVIMSGSLPPTITEEVYDRVISICNANKARFIMDVYPQEMVKLLDKGPMLIVADHDMIEKMLGVEIKNPSDLHKYAKIILDQGVDYLISPVEGRGSILFTKDKAYHGLRITGEYVNSEGVREAMIAGFIATYIRLSDPVEAYRVAIACGAATAFTRDMAKRPEIEEIIEKVEINKIDSSTDIF